MSVMLHHPQTEEQSRKWGSVMLIYKFLKILCGRNCFACFSTPMAEKFCCTLKFYGVVHVQWSQHWGCRTIVPLKSEVIGRFAK